MNTMIRVSALIFVFLYILPPGLTAQRRALESIKAVELGAHIRFLASDELSGRKTGEESLQVAARYLASQAERIGLESPYPGMFQSFRLVSREYDWENNGIGLAKDGQTLPLSGEVVIIPRLTDDFRAEGKLVFAGYGIDAPEYSYNDYEGLDVEGRLVMIMTGEPMTAGGQVSLFTDSVFSEYCNLWSKTRTALEKGAAGVIILPDPTQSAPSVDRMYQGLREYLTGYFDFPGEPEQQPLQIICIDRVVADSLLALYQHSLAGLQQKINSEIRPSSFILEGVTMSISAPVTSAFHTMSNVVGVLEGSDPVLKGEAIVLIAHYDHLGVRSDGEVYNGADDNASGCAALIEIAEAFSNLRKKPARTVIFLWVAAEEVGMYGSQYYTLDPVIPLEKTVSALNLDMIARVKDKRDTGSRYNVTAFDTLQILGGIQAPQLLAIALKHTYRSGLAADLSFNDPSHPSQKFFGSDHISFLRKDVPFLSFSTGIHADYHRVSDEFGKISLEKAERMTRLVCRIACDLSSRKTRVANLYPYSQWD